LQIGKFGFVSDFVFRISDLSLLRGKAGESIGEGIANRHWESDAAFAAELFVDVLKSMNQVLYVTSRKIASGGGAEVSAAAEGTIGVNQAFPLGGEHGAGSILTFGELGATAGFEGFGSEESFPTGEVGNFAGEFKLAAFRAAFAKTFGGAFGQIFVNGSDLGDGFSRFQRFAHGVGFELV
jgi:hypothetical protein